MNILMKVVGWVLLLAGVALIAYVAVAVATGAEGFTTLVDLVPGILVHAVTCVAGLQALTVAAKHADAEKGAHVPAAPTGAAHA